MERGEQHGSRRPMPWEKPAVTRWATSPSSKRSRRSRARSSQSPAAQPGRELEVLPRRRARHQAADVGAVADGLLDAERLRVDVVAGDEDAARRWAAPRPRARAWSSTCRHRCGRAARSTGRRTPGGRRRRRPRPRRSGRAGRGRRLREVSRSLPHLGHLARWAILVAPVDTDRAMSRGPTANGRAEPTSLPRGT